MDFLYVLCQLLFYTIVQECLHGKQPQKIEKFPASDKEDGFCAVLDNKNNIFL